MSTGPRRLGRYELQERLGRGGMAEVWKSMDIQLQRYVAIKFLHVDLRADPNFMTRFVREAQAIASLRHPNIVQIHDFQTPTESDDTAYMVMKYIEGPTLAEYIRNTSHQGNFPPFTDIMYIFSAINSAVDYAHQRGLIHRDIKPSNIMLDQRDAVLQHLGKPVLMDFGIVKLLGSSTHTLTGSFMGTPHYMSPEQALGRQGDGRSDIYSLGVILYELCTGVRPFQADIPSVIMMQHVNATPPSPELINPNIPPALTKVILCSLAKDPNMRFPDATTMTLAMADALNMAPPSNVSSTPTYPTGSQPRLPLMPSLPVNSAGLYVTGSTTPQFPVSVNDGQYASATPSTGSNATQPPASVTSFTPVLPPPTGTLLTRPPAQKKRKKILVFSLILLLLVLLGTGSGGFYLFTHQHVPAVAPAPIVGQAFFESSSQINVQGSQGIDDEMSINLSHIASPPTGKNYYAWLVSDEHQTPASFLLLGKLTVNAGTVTFFYPPDPQHTNLLQYYSQFLISEENTNSTPTHPTTQKRAWAYYAEIPQVPDGSLLNLSALDDIRFLLVRGQNITGGIDILFLKGTYQLLTLASSARDAWNNRDMHTLRNQLITMLDYIDGPTFIQNDVPTGTPFLVNPQFVQAPMLDFGQNQSPPGYISRLDNQLNFLSGSPGITPAINTIANQVRNDLPTVENQLGQVYKDAELLMRMNDNQLRQASVYTTVNDMAIVANSAYNEMNPSTNEPQGGALWIHTQVQNLATFQIKKYTP
jgi:serine/threonine protein kinase